MQRAFPNRMNWPTSNFFQYIYELKFWRYRPAIVWRSQIHFENQSDLLKCFHFHLLVERLVLTIAALLEMNSMSSCEAIQLCRAAANRETASLVSAAQAAFSASGIRRLQERVKPEHGFIWRGEWAGAFLGIQINFLARDKFFVFLVSQEDGAWRHWRGTLCFQLSWCGASPRPKETGLRVGRSC